MGGSFIRDRIAQPLIDLRPTPAGAAGPGHVPGKRLTVAQEKTGATVSLRILPALAESILAAPSGGLVFLLNQRGAHSPAGVWQQIRDRCDQAGLPKCSAHGLRKAVARRFAEAGCSNQEIKACTGHTTDSEVARYTAAAAERRGRREADGYTLRHSTITDLVNLGLPLLTVAQISDTSAEMIERHYGHLCRPAAAEALAVLAL